MSIMVFQFPLVAFLSFILTEITEATGTYCASSMEPYSASIWLSVISGISTEAAVTSTLKFYGSMKVKVGQRKPLSKLFGFKAIVGVTWIQSVRSQHPSFPPTFKLTNTLQMVFSFLTSSSDLKPTSKLTYKDLTVAIPNLIVCLEMILFSLAFLKVFRVSEYHAKKGASAVPLGHGGYYGGFMGIGAIFDALNFSDVARAIIGALKGGLQDRKGGYTSTKAYGTGAQDFSVRLIVTY
jgi:hypothetical protein